MAGALQQRAHSPKAHGDGVVAIVQRHVEGVQVGVLERPQLCVGHGDVSRGSLVLDVELVGVVEGGGMVKRKAGRGLCSRKRPLDGKLKRKKKGKRQTYGHGLALVAVKGEVDLDGVVLALEAKADGQRAVEVLRKSLDLQGGDVQVRVDQGGCVRRMARPTGFFS